MYPGELKNVSSCKNVNTNIYSSITHNGKKVKIDKYIYMYIYILFIQQYMFQLKKQQIHSGTLKNLETIILNEIIKI